MAKSRVVTKRAGPFIGVHGAPQGEPFDPRYADLLRNCYPADMDVGPLVVGRPGFRWLGAQLGRSGHRVGQRAHQYTQVNGSEFTTAIVGGELFVYNWGSNTWAAEIQVADLAAASPAITLNDTGAVYAVTFADQMIVSDGSHKAFAWDGTSGAGLTLLSNTPAAFFGQPWVYYGKLFGIRADQRTEMVWSEEGLPNTGYVATIGGVVYNNGWDLIQTDPHALYAGIGLNEIMYLFRQTSVTAVSGKVGPDFATAGQRESVSEDVGCVSPRGVTVKNGIVFFMGSNRRLYRIPAGGFAEEVGKGARRVLETIPSTYLSLAQVVDHPGTDLVLFHVVGINSTALNLVLAVDSTTGEYVGEWNGWQSTALDIVRDSDGIPTMTHLGGSTATTSATGYAYAHGRLDGSPWTDGFAAGSAAITHSVRTEMLGYSETAETDWDLIDATVLLRTNLTNVGVSYVTPRQPLGTTQQFASVTGGGAVLGAFVLGTDTLASDVIAERHLVVGTAAQGRWIMPVLTHETLGERFMLSTIVATGYPQDDQPEYR